MKPFLLLGLAVLLMPLSGCTVNPATGEQSFTGFMSASEEARIGRTEGAKAVKQFGGTYNENDLASYVQRIGSTLAQVSETPEIPFTFTLLNTDMVNAFALPGGYVYVTRGIMALAENEAELAGVLGHEIGHVVARHSAQRYSLAQGIGIAGVVAQVLGLPPGLGDVAAQGAEMYLMSFSRDQELEADMLGVRYLARAGYDPNAMVSFFRKLEAQTGLLARMEGRRETNTPDMMATHPRTSDRIVQAIDLVKRAEATPGARLDRDAYLNRINGMLFGDDPRQGIVKGRTFIHPDLGFQFVVPPGFTLFNGDKQVIARGPNGAIIAFDLDQGARSRTPPASYLTDVWAQGKRLNSVENLQINGMQAATGTTQGSQGGTTFDLRLIAIRDDVGRMFRFMFVTPRSVTAALAQELQRTTFSFRSLSEAEARSARPLRLRVVPSGGQSIDSLAARMPFENYSRPWFEVLNGLEPGQTALRTSRVKVVAE